MEPPQTSTLFQLSGQVTNDDDYGRSDDEPLVAIVVAGRWSRFMHFGGHMNVRFMTSAGL